MGLYAGPLEAADPAFMRLLKLLRALQQARATEAEIIRRADHDETWFMIHSIDLSQTVLTEQVAELKTLLDVPNGVDRVKVVFGMFDPEPGVIGIRTRYLRQILSTLGAGVQIPPEHLTDGDIVSVDAFHALR